jgi:DNA polymerase-1
MRAPPNSQLDPSAPRLVVSAPVTAPTSVVTPAPSPRLFLVDGYALIYRAFFALISRPLTTSRGENTSAAWGIVNFLNRLLERHRPEYLGWVHDSGLSFRHETYPAYKATREKLTEELQSDFDRGMERICALLEAYRVQILTLRGYEADDVIGTLARQAVARAVNVVVVSGDKDFQQLVQPGIWLLNPGRGGPGAVEEQWVSVENGSDRLGVPPALVTDYLALVGDTSDNVPGVRGIGDKTAAELVNSYGSLEEILARAAEIPKKRPREALLEQTANARLSKELVTIRDDLPITLDLEQLRVREPDQGRLKQLFVELEFHSLAKQAADRHAAALAQAERIGDENDLPADASQATVGVAVPDATPAIELRYTTVDTPTALRKAVSRARRASFISIDTESVSHPDSPVEIDPLRSTIIGISMAVGPGEAYYFPLGHRERVVDTQAELSLDAGEPTEGMSVTDRDRERIAEAEAADEATDPDGQTEAGLDEGVLVDAAAETGRGKAGRKKTAAKSARKRATRKTAAAAAEPTSIAGRVLAAAGGRPIPVRNLPPLTDSVMAPLRELLEDRAVSKTAQNGKYDLLALRSVGVEIQGLDFDTMLASYVLDPGRRSHGLDVLALEFLDHLTTSYEELCGRGKNAIPYDQVPIECATDYACEDADVTWRLRQVFESQLEAQRLMSLFRQVEIPLVRVLADMEWAGISIDGDWFRSLKARFARERQRVEEEIYTEAGERFNINSNPKLREILFDRLKLPVLKRTATGPSTDASVLRELADEGHSLPVLLMEYRELSKLESTYIDALPVLVNPRTQRLHTSFNQTVAATGRLSSNEPNLQNIPIRRELGRDIRRGFIPRNGWLLLSADYSQIELRLLAHLSGDPAFVEAFRTGGDIHRQTAALIFDVPPDQVTSDMRGRAKTINFATIYGQGPHALSRQLKISHAEAREFIERYFERFRSVREYLDASVEFARKNGYAQTIFGRRRYIPELRDRNFNVRAFGERAAANSPIQGSAADLIKMAMINIDRALRDRRCSSRMLLQVHDELVFEVPGPERDDVAGLVVHEMEHAAELSVPLLVDLGFGRNWLETKMGEEGAASGEAGAGERPVG